MDLIVFITYPKGMLQVLSLLSADEERAAERTFGRVENCTYSHEGKAEKSVFLPNSFTYSKGKMSELDVEVLNRILAVENKE